MDMKVERGRYIVLGMSNWILFLQGSHSRYMREAIGEVGARSKMSSFLEGFAVFWNRTGYINRNGIQIVGPHAASWTRLGQITMVL